jgi:hypothetical protein
LLTFYDDPPDRRITEDDMSIYFGLVFEDWEADLGRTYALGADPHKAPADRGHRLRVPPGTEACIRTHRT